MERLPNPQKVVVRVMLEEIDRENTLTEASKKY